MTSSKNRTKSCVSCISLVILSVALHCFATEMDEQAFIAIQDRSTGCSHDDGIEYRFEEKNGRFVCRHKSVDRAWVKKLRDTLLTSKSDITTVKQSLGITPANVLKHREEIFNASLSNWPDVPRPKSIPASCASLFEYEYVSKVAMKNATEPAGSTTEVIFEAVISGNPRIVVRSDHEAAWMLPWTIQADGKKWQTFDIQVPLLLSELADPAGPNAALLDGREYWAKGFWNDSSVWTTWTIGDKINAQIATEMYESLSGYPAAASLFTVERPMIGNVNLNPLSLYLNLHTRPVRTLDAARWYNLISNGHPTTDWNQFIQLFESASRACRKFDWLEKWKASENERSIELQAVGTVGIAETNLSLKAIPAWAKANLKGRPEYQLLMRSGNRWWAELYLSSQEDRALGFHFKSNSGRHWLDKLDLQHSEFVTIDETGKLERFVLGDQ